MTLWTKGLLPVLALAVLIMGFGTVTAEAEERRKIPRLHLAVHKQLQKARKAIDINDFANARQILEKTSNRKKINEYERALIEQARAEIAVKAENTPAAIHAYENMLKFNSSIPKMLEMETVYHLWQLYFVEKDYEKATKHAKAWQQIVPPEFVGTAQFKSLALLDFRSKRYDSVLDHAASFLKTASTENMAARGEGLRQTTFAAYWRLENYDSALGELNLLLKQWPSEKYCQIAVVVLEAKGFPRNEALGQTKKIAPICSSTSTSASPEGLISQGDFAADEHQNTDTAKAEQLPYNHGSVSPAYPRRAIKDNVEGYVVVELTVNESGAVDKDSIKIIESSPKGYFEEAAKTAAIKFRYRPKVVNGRSQKVTGVKYRFSFNLAQ